MPLFRCIKTQSENVNRLPELSRPGNCFSGMQFIEAHRYITNIIVCTSALALLLETTAFMSELVLHFPDICHEVLSKHQDSQLSLTWGILFASQSSFLDESTKKLVYLVSFPFS